VAERIPQLRAAKASVAWTRWNSAAPWGRPRRRPEPDARGHCFTRAE